MDDALRGHVDSLLGDSALPESLRAVLGALARELGAAEHERLRLFDELVLERSAKQSARDAGHDRDRLLEMFFAQSLDGFYIMAMEEPVRWEPAAPDGALLEAVYTRQHVTHVNPAIAAQYGAAPAELLGKSPAEFYAGNSDYGRSLCRRLLDEGRLHIVTEERKFDGSAMWIEGDYISLYDQTGSYAGHFGIQREVTERVRAERALQHNAIHDPLTGLHNRAYFMEALERRIAQARREPERRYAVLFLDLDRFKRINDSHGHLLGDRLLVEAARRMESCVRAADLLARLGGDEFGVLADGVDVTEAVRLAERLALQLERAFQVDGQEHLISVSTGIAPGHASHDGVTLLRDADIAMYRAKAAGGSRYAVFDSHMHAQVSEQLRLENDLRLALGRRQFVLHYQPVVELGSGGLAGFEALVRWRHPERGLLLPDDFIPLAEETGLMPALGGWVLREALAQLALWRAAHLGAEALVMHLNVSGKQVQAQDFTALLERALQETGVPPGTLSLELTESVLLSPSPALRASLDATRGLGVQLSMDDFGTGYSSLSGLLHHPFASVKIDRSFVSGGDPRGPLIERAIVGLARSLGLDTVAEGIETADQLQRLRELGCERGQGFLFARALPPAEAERWIVAGHAPD